MASRFRNERLCRYCSSMHVRTNNDHYDRWSSMCSWISFRDLSFCFTFISYFLFAIRKTRARRKFQRTFALEEKTRPGKLPRRGSQQMVSHLLDHLNDSRVWEVILVTTLSLCSFSICSCSYFVFSVIVHLRFGQIAFFLVSVARNWLRFKLVLRRNDNRVCFRVATYDFAIFKVVSKLYIIKFILPPIVFSIKL